MPSRPLLPLLLFTLSSVALPGCVSTGAGGFSPPAAPDDILAALSQPGTSGRGLRGEAEVALSLHGRSVSLPGAVVIAPPDRFRIDLLDPLDRPAAVIFTDGLRLVYYQPAAATAAVLFPLPGSCRGVVPGEWAGFLTGGLDGQEGGWQLHSLPGGRRLVRYEAASLRQEVSWREEGGRLLPRSSDWHCGGRPVVRLAVGAFLPEGENRIPSDFEVTYPASGLKLSFRFTTLETVGGLDESLLRPPVSGRVRWTSWDLFPDD